MTRLEWQSIRGYQWEAKSGVECTDITPRWYIWTNVAGEFIINANYHAMSDSNMAFQTLAEAQAWCQKQEDELCQKT